MRAARVRADDEPRTSPAHAAAPDAALVPHEFLDQRYAQYVRRACRRSGPLCEGRFRSSLVPSPRYVLACHRYVEMNPVRANMVKHPGGYPWSSYTSNGKGRPAKELVPHPEYLVLGSNQETRRAAYRGLFETGLDQELLRDIRASVHGGCALEWSAFREQIELARKRRAGQF